MLSMVEFWRRELDHAPFSADFYEKAGAATNWLFQMTDPLSGDSPNLGANDGARLFVLTDTPYRDYRPTVQLASTLFSGTRSHNTVQFDDRNQMPRVGRFLFGAWPKGIFDNEVVQEDDLLFWSASCQDFRGCRHKRTIKVKNNVWQIIDEINGFENKAVLRWRLAPGDWHLNGQKCCGDVADISVKSSVPITRCEIVTGWESGCYMKITELPVLEVSIGAKPATLITEIDIKI